MIYTLVDNFTVSPLGNQSEQTGCIDDAINHSTTFGNIKFYIVNINIKLNLSYSFFFYIVNINIYLN